MNNMHKIPTLLIFRYHKLITDGIEIVLAPRLNNLAKHKITIHVIAMFVSRRHATDSGDPGANVELSVFCSLTNISTGVESCLKEKTRCLVFDHASHRGCSQQFWFGV